MGKTTKKPKLKGYGAYWTGDIKNKHIRRKNKQYIRDQKYLHVYKKIKDSNQHDDVSQLLRNDSKSVDNFNNLTGSVNLIRPQIETTYLSHSEDDQLYNTSESDPDKHDIQDEDDKEDVVNEYQHGEYDHEDSTSKQTSNLGDESKNRRKGNPYSKVLNKIKEIEKQKKESYNQKVEEIKRKKKEIREKKQKRYDRHRLLGARTKRGQPIMKNVIKHLMRNFKPD